MGINFDLINSMGGNRGAWHVYASRHHISTKETPWTDEEFEAGRERYGNYYWGEANREFYAEDYLNWHKESARRCLERAMNDNQFSFVIQDFDPNNVIGGRREFSHQSNVFQVLANTFESQMKSISSLRDAFGGRFLGEADLEVRLNVIHEQFNEAFRSVAELVRIYASQFVKDAQRVADDILTVGQLIRNHISSGNSADSIEAMVRNNKKTVMSFDEMNDLAMAVHQQFKLRA
ncbi:MAG: hypothetical protein FWE27_06920 [Defluviitaleaceae bacterium]|nr:hypothetical protein [Defluviitaleaceae bacterium]